MPQNKNVTKVISLLVAIVIWAYVIAIENPPTTQPVLDVPVELLNVGTLAHNGLAVVDSETATVDITLSGTRADIIKYKDEIIVTANVFGYGMGDNYVTVDVLVNDSLSYSVNPSQILVKLENLVSLFKPVSVTYTGEQESGTEPGNVVIQPEEIEIKGPQSIVESVSYVGIDVPYSNITRSGADFTAEAFAFNAAGERVENISLSADVVNVGATLYDTKVVPLSVNVIGQVGEQYEMTSLDFPDTIKIRGSKSELLNIDLVESEPVDISAVESTSELPVLPILPQGIELARDSYNLHGNIGIKGISTRSFEYNSPEIAIEGLGEGLKAYINTPSVMLKAAGKEEIISAGVKEDFRLFVDLTDMAEGTYIVPVAVAHDRELSRLEITPEEVHITVSSGEGEEAEETE